MTPSKETLENQAKHFANTVFAIGAGVLILGASLLQPYAVTWVGSDVGGHMLFIGATILIFVLSTKRVDFALFAFARQCKKYGHVPSDELSLCSRCHQDISGLTK